MKVNFVLGMVIPDADQEEMTERLRTEYSALPIYLDEEVADKHYNGFSNSILWYLPPPRVHQLTHF
jgi:trehalose 6-phosphate synthase